MSNIMNCFEFFSSLNWGDNLDINREQEFVKIKESENYLIKKQNGFYKIWFYQYKKGNIIKGKFKIPILIKESLNILDYITIRNRSSDDSGYLIENAGIINSILPKGINVIKISDDYSSNYSKYRDELRIKTTYFKSIIKTAEKVHTKGSNFYSRVITYHTGKERFRLFGEVTKPTTTIGKGDFSYIIDRFNLSTKKDKSDFTRFLNNEDIEKLGILLNEMLKKEVFPNELILRIKDYFIKEKLEDIISRGKKILNIKTTNVETQTVQEIIKEVLPGEDIYQLETVRQRYFEKYLLYLFFSYRKILPKLKFTDLANESDKYPDFVGLNHYNGIDIIEIKTHLAPILSRDDSHKNFSFTPEMSKAIIQTINYMDLVISGKVEDKNHNDILSELNVRDNLYRPKGIIIISSKNNLLKGKKQLNDDERKLLERDFTKLRNSLHNIEIFTFDEILEIAERYIENINDSNL